MLGPGLDRGLCAAMSVAIFAFKGGHAGPWTGSVRATLSRVTRPAELLSPKASLGAQEPDVCFTEKTGVWGEEGTCVGQ